MTPMGVLAFIQAVAPLVPHVIRLVEQTIPGPKKGKAKRKKAIAAIEALAGGVPLAVKEIKQIGALVDKAVDDFNALNP